MIIVSSYIRRQSRAIRKNTVVTTAGLDSILEEPEITEKKSKKNSMKARRRLGVSDLAIPRSSPLFTAVQGLDDAEWRLRLPMEDTKEDATFDFPRPPLPVFEPISDESESSGSESGEGSSSGSESPMSGMPTTPTAESYELRGQCVIRCRSIKPLTINKRSVSPIPPVPSLPLCESAAEGQDVWQDDDEYYTTEASSYITLTAPLPPSFPALPAPTASTARAARRESAIISPASIRPSSQLDAAHRASVRLSRPINIPTRAPPPPPIITSHSHSHSRSPTSSILTSASSPPRPPPRTPVPTDALGDDADYVYAPPLVSRTPSPSSSNSSSSARLAALLSPPTQRFPGDAVPCDVASADEDEGDGEWEDLEIQYDDVPLSPLVASAPVVDEDVFGEQAPLSPQTPYPPALRSRWSVSTRAPPTPFTPGLESPTTPYTPALRSRWSASTRAPATPYTPHTPFSPCAPETSSTSYAPYNPDTPEDTPESPLRSRWSASTTGAPPTPGPAHVLRSRWSSSTLSSVRSAHAHGLRSPASPKTFAFARRYFPRSPVKSSSTSTHTSSAKATSASKSKPMPKAMGTTPIPRARPGRKNKKKLTVADVIVPHVIVGRPPSASVLASACTSPDVFATPAPWTPMPPMPPYSASGQWAGYPASPPLASKSKIGTGMGANASGPSAPSAALYAAYTTQRSPRRRVSTASNASGWSYSSSSPSHGSEPGHSSHGSESGHSECSAGSVGSALRRKPIPVEMFLR
ncbi:hypothetical protein DFH06DRAFT_1320618 [Mycena polygramma]|nr:hypothetical protein DFH06DRAFT_1320618 [Mycena polygramma]